ncbi:MAG TPA: pilus assembly protein TadG-related protein [Gemmataceae bacterium]|nr:pilus assembly protein TadG-related protein [Gemmataceae bacterium]
MFLVRSKQRASRRGAVAIWVAVCLTVLLGIVAIALDGGSLLSERRHAQAVADAAALAAACDLYDNYWLNSGDDPSGTAKASALTTAASNGYTNDGIKSTVTVHIPPQSGDYVGRRGYVEVNVQYNEGRTFSNIFRSGPIPVRARAVALGAPIAADVGILVLDPSAKGAFNANGSGTTTVNDTPVVVNSNHPEAAIAGGGGYVVAPEFDITGGYTTTGGGQFIGTMKLGRRGLTDPLEDLPPPDPSRMSIESRKKIQYTSGSVTLKPGVYKGGISVSGTGSLTLEPGIYYMDGGGFSFSGQGSLVGRGVMIYNAPGNGNADGISVTGQGSMILSGPTSGIYQGITFFQDRKSGVSGTVEGTGGQTDITGTFYFAGAHLKVSGNGGVSNLGSQYISRLLTLGGNGGINIQWKPDSVARKRSIFLVE